MTDLPQEEAGWSRDPARDLLLWPGHTATITARPQVQDNQGASSLVECRRDAFGDVKKVSYTRAGCRNTVMQMIAEKSVNCSLLSLPASPGTDLPFCGPLEGLALMYILREQGDLVHQNPKIRSRFEANLKEKCPMECERKYWEADVISAEVEDKVGVLSCEATNPLHTGGQSFRSCLQGDLDCGVQPQQRQDGAHSPV